MPTAGKFYWGATLLDALKDADVLRMPLIVLDGREWTGVVTDDEWMSPPARLCYFALTLELEERASRLCHLFPRETVDALPQRRLKQARKIFDRRRQAKAHPAVERALKRLGRHVDVTDQSRLDCALLIDCTMFVDKDTGPTCPVDDSLLT